MSEIGRGDVESMNGIYWNMHATSMKCVCGMYGMCMESVWNMYGIRMEYVWNICRITWNVNRVCMTMVGHIH